MLFKIAVRVLVFGLALALVSRGNPRVRIQPRSALPLVALVFALLNTFLYGALKLAMNLGTLWLLWFVTPLLVNAALLWATDKLSRPLRIDGVGALLGASFVMTLAHVGLRLLHF